MMPVLFRRRKTRLCKILAFTPFAQPQTGNNPITSQTDIPGLEDAYDTLGEIVNKVKQLDAIPAQNIGTYSQFTTAYNAVV
jgi:hypothetical protein